MHLTVKNSCKCKLQRSCVQIPVFVYLLVSFLKLSCTFHKQPVLKMPKPRQKQNPSVNVDALIFFLIPIF